MADHESALDYTATGHDYCGFMTGGPNRPQKGIVVSGWEYGVHGSGDSSGVLGESIDGEGVRGESGLFYGGSFKSGSRAQIHLEPLVDTPNPPFVANQAIWLR